MDGERRSNAVGLGLLLLTASVSAGVHAALAPEHLHEWPPLGAAFVAAAVAVSAAVVAFVARPADAWPSRALALLLASLVAGYYLTRLAALPPLDPEREPLDALGVFTTVLEAAGLFSVLLLRLVPRGGTP
jgi:hypothetical protein